jgi:cytidine deaminase
MSGPPAPPTRIQLLELARGAAQVAHCPYSQFRVGAAVLAGGQMFTGCNIENASYGLTVCAERSAIFRAVAAGERAISALAVSCPDVPGDAIAASRMPCGACRQVLAEFAAPNLVVIVDKAGEFTLDELLPHTFSLLTGMPQPRESYRPSRPRLCIDIDNVIAETDVVMRKIIREYTQGRVRLRYEDITEFDYRNCADSAGEKLRRGNPSCGILDEWHAVHDLFSGRVSEVEPYPDIRQILSQLSQTFELHLATSRLYGARAGTVAWLLEHGFPEDVRLHFLLSGEKHLSIGRFFAAVEDELDQAIASAKAGIHSFVRAHPWNSAGENTLLHRYATWEEIVPALLALAGSAT